MKEFAFFTEDDLPMVSETQVEVLARKSCEDFMTACNLQNIEQAKLASQKMLAMAKELFDTMNDGNLQMETVR
jgi:hypothetical protein